MNEFGFSFSNLSVADFVKPENIIQPGYEPNRIDVITTIDGVTFDNCYKGKIVVEDEGLQIKVINHYDLIANKKASGRHRDLDDVENLKSNDD